MSEILVNKVADSGIITLNLESFYPKEPVVVFDMKDFLFMGLILKEKDYRESLKTLDISAFQDKIVTLTCTADAVIPMWAYMLAASLLQPVAHSVYFGTVEETTQTILLTNIAQINAAEYEDKRVVVKGCGELPVREAAYVTITALLRPFAKSIMYGEPCSTVPVFKKPLVRS